jgi:hypothetical protein
LPPASSITAWFLPNAAHEKGRKTSRPYLTADAISLQTSCESRAAERIIAEAQKNPVFDGKK